MSEGATIENPEPFSENWIAINQEEIEERGGLKNIGAVMILHNETIVEVIIQIELLATFDFEKDNFIENLTTFLDSNGFEHNDDTHGKIPLSKLLENDDVQVDIFKRTDYIEEEDLIPKINEETVEKLTKDLVEKLSESFETTVGYIDAEEQHAKASEPWRDEHKLISDWEKLIIEQKGRLGDIIAFDISGHNAHKLLRGTILKEIPGEREDYWERLKQLDQENKTEHRVALNRLHGIRVIIARPTVLTELGISPCGILLSGNGLPIMKDLTRDVSGGSGYLKDMHIIVDVDETLGYGKKSVGTRMKYYYPLIGKMWKALFMMAQLVVGNEGGGTGSKFSKAHKRMKLTKIERECMEDLFGRSSIPKDENCVIAAHNYWLGKKKGGVYNPRWLTISSKTTIDGLALNIEDGEFQALDSGGTTTGVTDAQCMKVEYKLNGKSLIDQNKNMKQMFKYYNVGIAWHSLKKSTDGYNVKWKSQHAEADWPMHSQVWIHEAGSETIGEDGASGIYFTSLELIYYEALVPLILSRLEEIKDNRGEAANKEKTLLTQAIGRIKKGYGIAELHSDL